MSESGEGPRPKTIQARIPSPTKEDNSHRPTAKGTIAGLIIAGAAIGGANAVATAIEDLKPNENYSSLQGREIKLDGRTVSIVGNEVQIRNSSKIPHGEGEDNRFNKELINSINGEPWDGKSNFKIENFLRVDDIDPSDGSGTEPWIVVEVGMDNGKTDLGYISLSTATSGVVETVTKGEVADVKFDQNNNLKATFDSGRTISEDEIGKVKIINPQQSES